MAQRSSPQRHTVLIVEDDAQSAKLLKVLCRARGYGVREAADVVSALALIKRKPPQLIVTDLRLPGTSGVSLIRYLRDDPSTRDIPVIAATAWDEDVPSALAAGALACCIKPIDVDRFSLLVGNVLGDGAPPAVAHEQPTSPDTGQRAT
jgi:CheY-like chemotaxis protein